MSNQGNVVTEPSDLDVVEVIVVALEPRHDAARDEVFRFETQNRDRSPNFPP
jgi:hypothetical protein